MNAGHEARECRTPRLHAPVVGHLAAQVVAVVEHHRAPRLELQHRLARATTIESSTARLVAGGIALAERGGLRPASSRRGM